jgi:hypothetical protein
VPIATLNTLYAVLLFMFFLLFLRERIVKIFLLQRAQR